MLIAKIQELAENRVTKGWTKGDLAKEAGVPHTVIVRAEQGLGMSPKSAKAIADALEKPVLDLFAVCPKPEA